MSPKTKKKSLLKGAGELTFSRANSFANKLNVFSVERDASFPLTFAVETHEDPNFLTYPSQSTQSGTLLQNLAQDEDLPPSLPPKQHESKGTRSTSPQSSGDPTSQYFSPFDLQGPPQVPPSTLVDLDLMEKKRGVTSSFQPSRRKSLALSPSPPSPQSPKSSIFQSKTSPLPTSIENPPSSSPITPLDGQLFLAKDGYEKDFMSSLDTWSGLYRRAIMSDFIHLKTQMAEKHAVQLANHRGDDAKIISGLEETIHLQGQEIERGLGRVERRSVNLDATSSLVLELKARACLPSTFYRWKLRKAARDSLHFQENIAQKHAQKVMARKVILGWYRTTALSFKAIMEKNITKAAEVRIQHTLDEYEAKFQLLNKKLQMTLIQLAGSERERDVQEQDMKKTFMRGVCALNMEAMSMFEVPPVVSIGMSKENVRNAIPLQPTSPFLQHQRDTLSMNEKSTTYQRGLKGSKRSSLVTRHF